MEISVSSEFGTLEGVILHSPGAEVENMTPENAQRALYSDILNLSIAKKEYQQVIGVLSKVTQTFEVKDLLAKTLSTPSVKEELVKNICAAEKQYQLVDELLALPPAALSKALIEGLPLKRNNLTTFLSEDRYSLHPLFNFYFTRDASISINNKVLIGKMANKVRDREATIMEAIFNHSGEFSTSTINPYNSQDARQISIEGGDVLIAREDVLIIGNGCRTTSQGIDFILSQILQRDNKSRFHIIVQELPHTPESFIHLDMVFTLLDFNKCMVYEPIILDNNKFQTVHITVDNGTVSIRSADSILSALRSLGIDLEPIVCGGTKDSWTQEREQWHSGANFFALGPGKVMGYARNVNTLEEMNKHGFEIIRAKDVITNHIDLSAHSRYVVAIDGSELPRGGGGARCMTMPVRRTKISW
jgi:arginine deiminase